MLRKFIARVSLLASVALLALVGCRARPTDARVLRLGYFPNLTHAPALTGVRSGRFAAALPAGVRLDAKTFSAGPAEMEAMLAGELDVAYVGPGPAVAAYLRTRGAGLRVIAGATSGGALFVVRAGRGIRGPEHLHGRKIATPQLGNTQDIALRRYLLDHGLDTTERGGDVTVLPMEPSGILTQFRRGELDGAWVAEPWGSRLVQEAGGEVLLDERTLWPDQRFATTIIVARARFLRDARPVVAALLRAHRDEVARILRDADTARNEVNQAIGTITAHPLGDGLLRAAWGRVDFTTDPMRASLVVNAQAAHRLGFVTGSDVSALVDTSVLDEVGSR